MTLDLTGATWRKSQKSASNGGCVEVADLGSHIAVRDSKNPTGAKLIFTPHEWDSFLDGAQSGEFAQPS